jgi:HK97 family phage major capsid protein
MTFHSRLETKSATELPADDNVTEIKSALDNLVKDVGEKTKPIADLEKRLAAAEQKLARPNINTQSNADEAKELEAKAFNNFLRNGAAALDDAEKKTLNWGTGTAGGYVTAPEYSTVVRDKLVQFSPMRSVASIMTIGAGKVYIPVGDTALSPGWVTETGARSSSEPVFDQIEIDAFEQAVVVPVSQQLLEDTFIDLQAYIAGQMATLFAKLEATAFLTGNGSGKPTGLLNTPSDYTQITAAADGSDIIEAVIKAFYTLPGAYASRGAWFMNRAMQGVIRAAADTTTKGTLWSDSLANGTPARLLGAPVYDAPDMDGLPTATGTKYPIVFSDFASSYQIVDRVGVQVLRDDLTGADNGIVKFRGRKRVGGAPILAEAAVLVKSTKA